MPPADASDGERIAALSAELEGALHVAIDDGLREFNIHPHKAEQLTIGASYLLLCFLGIYACRLLGGRVGLCALDADDGDDGSGGDDGKELRWRVPSRQRLRKKGGHQDEQGIEQEGRSFLHEDEGAAEAEEEEEAEPLSSRLGRIQMVAASLTGRALTPSPSPPRVRGPYDAPSEFEPQTIVALEPLVRAVPTAVKKPAPRLGLGQAPESTYSGITEERTVIQPKPQVRTLGELQTGQRVVSARWDDDDDLLSIDEARAVDAQSRSASQIPSQMTSSQSALRFGAGAAQSPRRWTMDDEDEENTLL